MKKNRNLEVIQSHFKIARIKICPFENLGCMVAMSAFLNTVQEFNTTFFTIDVFIKYLFFRCSKNHLSIFHPNMAKFCINAIQIIEKFLDNISISNIRALHASTFITFGVKSGYYHIVFGLSLSPIINRLIDSLKISVYSNGNRQIFSTTEFYFRIIFRRYGSFTYVKMVTLISDYNCSFTTPLCLMRLTCQPPHMAAHYDAWKLPYLK